jgi:dTMP kinase
MGTAGRAEDPDPRGRPSDAGESERGTPAAPRTGFGAVLRTPRFRRLLIGQTVSSLGDWVATLAFIAAAFALTHDQTAVAAVLILRLVPPIFAAPIGGVVADRFNRRIIMVTSDLSRAGLIALVPFVRHIAFLYAIAFVHECISLFFLPARDASVPELAPAGSLEEANGLILGSSYGTLPIAAALFGVLRLAAQDIPSWVPFAATFAAYPTAFAFLFDAASFLFSALMIAGIRFGHARAEGASDLHVLGGLAEAYRYVAHSPRLRALAYGLIVSMFGGGVLFAIGIAYIHVTLHAGDTQFGWLAALWGAGMGIGLGAQRLLVRERGEAWAFLLSVTLCGAILIAMAVVPWLWLAFAAAVVFGAAFSAAIVIALSMAQRATEDSIRGRVMGGVQMLFRIGLAAGALGIGGLAQSIDQISVGPVTLDGNQVGMIVGGTLIILGAAASNGVLRSAAAGREGRG